MPPALRGLAGPSLRRPGSRDSGASRTAQQGAAMEPGTVTHEVAHRDMWNRIRAGRTGQSPESAAESCGCAMCHRTWVPGNRWLDLDAMSQGGNRSRGPEGHPGSQPSKSSLRGHPAATAWTTLFLRPLPPVTCLQGPLGPDLDQRSVWAPGSLSPVPPLPTQHGTALCRTGVLSLGPSWEDRGVAAMRETVRRRVDVQLGARWVTR